MSHFVIFDLLRTILERGVGFSAKIVNGVIAVLELEKRAATLLLVRIFIVNA